MKTALMFSTGKDDWQTPPDLYAELNAEFNFDIDLAASRDNTLSETFYTERCSAFDACWSLNLEFCAVGFCNPPYSRGLQGKFIAKAASERRNGFTTVMLLPARTDTRAFHSHVWCAQTHKPREGVEVRFLPGRIKFVGAKHGAPFPSMIVVFRGAR